MKFSIQAFTGFFSLALLLFINSVHGQNQANSAWFDSLTYHSYMKQEWPAVLRSGKSALAKGYDYYYLRMRMAAAFYETGKYRSAIDQYNKASGFNSWDESVKTGKYYSYLNLGDRDNAALVSSSFSKTQKIKSGIPAHNPLDFIYLESGFSPDSKQGMTNSELTGPDSIYGEEDLYKGMFYLQAGARFRLLPSLSVYGGYTSMNIDKEKRFTYTVYPAHRDTVIPEIYGLSYYYSFSKTLSTAVQPYKTRQTDLYLNLNYLVNEGFRVSPAIHFIQVKSKNISATYGTSVLSDTAYLLSADSSWHTFQYSYSGYTLNQVDTTYNNYVLSLSASKELGNFSVEAHGSFSRLNSGKQKQIGANLTWYPLGNTDFFTSTSLNATDVARKRNLVFEQMIGKRFSRYLWLDGFITAGNLNLYNEKSGFVVYNQSDPITFRFGADAVIAVGKHLEIYLVYRYYRKESSFLNYTVANPGNGEAVTAAVSNTHLYNNQSYIGGLKWKF